MRQRQCRPRSLCDNKTPLCSMILKLFPHAIMTFFGAALSRDYYRVLASFGTVGVHWLLNTITRIKYISKVCGVNFTSIGFAASSIVWSVCSWRARVWSRSVKLFWNLNCFFWGTSIPQIYILILKIDIFRGDRNDISGWPKRYCKLVAVRLTAGRLEGTQLWPVGSQLAALGESLAVRLAFCA